MLRITDSLVRRLRAALLAGMILFAAAVPASAQNVQVTAADPPSGAQDTVALVVKITGKNFQNGAQVDFFRSGTTDPAGISVRATRFISATQLEATVDIAADAALSYFDVRVRLLSGRSGKGSDLFRVVEKSQALGGSRDEPVTVVTGTTPDAGIYEAAPGTGVFLTDATEQVAAELRAGVNVFLDLGSTKRASPRDVCVDLGTPMATYAGASLGLLPGSVACADMHWNTSDSGLLTAMTAGSSLRKRMQIGWEANGGTYYLRWGTTEADWVTVTCDVADARGCMAWTVGAEVDRVAQTGPRALLKYTSKRTGWVDVAEYLVPVSIAVQR